MKKKIVILLALVIAFSCQIFAQTAQPEIYDAIAGFNYEDSGTKITERNINSLKDPKHCKTYVDVVFRILEPEKVNKIVVLVGKNKNTEEIASERSILSKDGDKINYKQRKVKREIRFHACSFRFPVTSEQKNDAKWVTVFLEKKDGTTSSKFYLELN